MPGLDKVSCRASEFVTNPATTTVLDLAYIEYVMRAKYGEANAHVEAYYFYLAFKHPNQSSFKLVD